MLAALSEANEGNNIGLRMVERSTIIVEKLLSLLARNKFYLYYMFVCILYLHIYIYI